MPSWTRQPLAPGDAPEGEDAGLMHLAAAAVPGAMPAGPELRERAPIVTEPPNLRRYLRYLDEATEVPHRAPAPDSPYSPYFRSSAVRRKLTQQLTGRFRQLGPPGR